MEIGLGLANDSAQYELESAVLLYTHRDSKNSTSRSLAVHHGVVPHNGRATLGAGTFVTQDLYHKLLGTFERATLEFIPERVLGVSTQAIAWFEPASVQTMYFAPHSDTAVQRFDSKNVPQPALLFIAQPHGLSVYALPSDERPSEKTPLYVAPYWNVYDDHRVCIGSMKVPKTVDISSTKGWTDAFFGSNFTHHSGTRKRFALAGTYAELLAATVKEGRFRQEWLVSTTLTAARAIRGN